MDSAGAPWAWIPLERAPAPIFVNPSQCPTPPRWLETLYRRFQPLLSPRTLEAADWYCFAARQGRGGDRGKLYGRGLSPTSNGPARMVMYYMALITPVRVPSCTVVIWMVHPRAGPGAGRPLPPSSPSELLGIRCLADLDRMRFLTAVGGVGSMCLALAYIAGSALLTGSEKAPDKRQGTGGRRAGSQCAESSMPPADHHHRPTAPSAWASLRPACPTRRISSRTSTRVAASRGPTRAWSGAVEDRSRHRASATQRYTTGRRRRPAAVKKKKKNRPILSVRSRAAAPRARPGPADGEMSYDRGLSISVPRLVHGLCHAAPPRPSRPFPRRSTDSVPSKTNPLGAKGVG